MLCRLNLSAGSTTAAKNNPPARFWTTGLRRRHHCQPVGSCRVDQTGLAASDKAPWFLSASPVGPNRSAVQRPPSRVGKWSLLHPCLPASGRKTRQRAAHVDSNASTVGEPSALPVAQDVGKRDSAVRAALGL